MYTAVILETKTDILSIIQTDTGILLEKIVQDTIKFENAFVCLKKNYIIIKPGKDKCWRCYVQSKGIEELQLRAFIYTLIHEKSRNFVYKCYAEDDESPCAILFYIMHNVMIH